VARTEPSKTAEHKFPGGSVPPGSGELRIAIDKRPYASIIGHAMLEPEVEVCGVLVGRLAHDAHGDYVHITDVIRGEAAKQEGAQVTFTHDTWNHIHGEMDRQFSDREIVGWYHTHGGFGVFLSEMDTFIHENFFSASHQVAYVYDPLAGEEGFFRKQGDQLRPVPRYWLGGRERKVVAHSAAEAAPASGAGAPDVAATLQRTAQALNALAVARESEGTPLLVWMGIAGAVGLAAYSLYVRGPELPDRSAGAADPVPLLLIEQDAQGGHAVGVEVRAVDRFDGPVYRDENGRYYLGVEVRGMDGTVATSLRALTRPRATPPAAPSARPEARPVPRAAERSEAPGSRWVLVAAAAGVLLVLAAVLALLFAKRRRGSG
jgi:proteasome lid subunit RPN8/RPN11